MKQTVAQLFHSIAGRYGSAVLDHRSALVIGVQLALIMWDHVPAVLLIFGAGLWVFGIQRGLWRYVGLHDLGKILLASLTSAAVFYGVIHQIGGITQYPR